MKEEPAARMKVASRTTWVASDGATEAHDTAGTLTALTSTLGSVDSDCHSD